MKTKREMREAAIKRLRKHIYYPGSHRKLIHAIIGDDFGELTGNECVETIIDLLTDDEPQYEGDAFAKGPRDADGILWFRGDMSDSEWGVIERTSFDGERWMVCGHDISAPWIAADSIRHAPIRTATQREDDLIELPCDKYGEPWHVGDVTENGNVVMGMAIDNTGEWYFINTRNDIDPHAHYHHHKQTIKDVLREFSDEVRRCCDTEDTIAEYAKKLRLKED